MLELQIVNFNQAQSLKELGFPQDTDSWNYYDIDGKCVPYMQKGGYKEYCCDAPALSLVQKWLREEKCIDLFICFDGIHEVNFKYIYAIFRYLRVINQNIIRFESYDEALSAGIDKAIEMLQNE